MNNEIFKGKWNQLKGHVKNQWGKLTDNDIAQIQGKREMLLGKLQERYGWLKQRAEEELKRFEERSQHESQFISEERHQHERRQQSEHRPQSEQQKQGQSEKRYQGERRPHGESERRKPMGPQEHHKGEEGDQNYPKRKVG